MALRRRRKKKDPRDPGMRPSTPGCSRSSCVALAHLLRASRRANPFANPYEFTAVFKNVNNLKPKSPVRIAGVEVGKVDSVDGLPERPRRGRGDDGDQQDKGLPLHKDAQLKIRPRIFLEGNVFVDLQPGSPDAPTAEARRHDPGQPDRRRRCSSARCSRALQSDTRNDLQDVPRASTRKGLADGGAEGFNQADQVLEARLPLLARSPTTPTLGQRAARPLDASCEGQDKVFRALVVRRARAEEPRHELQHDRGGLRPRGPDAARRRSRRSTTSCGSAHPALASLERHAAVAALVRARRAAGREVVRADDRGLDAVRHAGAAAGQPRRSCAASPRTCARRSRTLAQLNHDSIPFLERDARAQRLHGQRAACRSRTRRSRIRTSTRRTRTSSTSRRRARSSGLAGESRINDGNTRHVPRGAGAGPFTVAQTDGAGKQIFGQRPTRPRPRGRPSRPPAGGPARTCPARRSSRRTCTRPRGPSERPGRPDQPDAARVHQRDGARHREAARERPARSPSGSRPCSSARPRACRSSTRW